MSFRSVAATADEHERQLPGDALIPDCIGQLSHAITIRRPPSDVWPWLVQMGAGSRAGWYSYDRLDNGGHPSARRIIPALQHIGAGTLFPALPGRTDGFNVLQIEPASHLVLGWLTTDGRPITTWAFVLEGVGGRTTRLVVRSRASRGYPFFGLPPQLGMPLVRAVHFIMQRKQLLGIAERVEQFDALLDRFIPDYDVVERHQIGVDAPADVTFDAASHVDMRSSALIRAIIGLRALAMGDDTGLERPHGLLAETTSMGWRVLAEVPGREVVLGAAAQPWRPNVTFEPIEPERFATFRDAGYVKIAWTLRVEASHPHRTIFSTETRAVATDEEARAQFRRYWLRVRPGVVAIRRLLLRMLKKDAEANRLESVRDGLSH